MFNRKVVFCLLGWMSLAKVNYSVGQTQWIEDAEPILELEVEDVRRPLWNVAHMVNALYQIDFYVGQGANSVEFDVSFNWEGSAQFTFHGIPCDCFRSCTKYENFVTYIDYLRQVTTPGNQKFKENLVLLFMDMKLSGLSAAAKQRAGHDVAMKMLDHYWQRGKGDARAYVLLSIPSINDAPFIPAFRQTMEREGYSKYLDRVGVDFSGNEDLDTIRQVLQAMKADSHIWQGDGITNCLPRGTGRLRDALSRRDRPTNSYIDKVYWWTVDKMSTVRTVLRLGVDGMITNYPDRLVKVLNEGEFSGKMRLATINDNPWKKYVPPTAALYGGVTGRGGNITDINILPDEDELLYNC